MYKNIPKNQSYIKVKIDAGFKNVYSLKYY